MSIVDPHSERSQATRKPTLSKWAERWTQLTTKHADPEVVLWSWCQEFLRRDLLPDRRVVVRFDFLFGGRKARGWLLIERREAELCRGGSQLR